MFRPLLILTIALASIALPAFAQGCSGATWADCLRITHCPTVGQCIRTVVNFFARNIVLPVAVIMIFWSGFVLATSQGNETRITSARKTLTAAIIGIIIAFAAVGLADALINTIEAL